MLLGRLWEKYFTLLAVLVTALVLATTLTTPTARQEAVELPRDLAYAYVLNLTNTGITPVHAVGISPSKILIAGRIGDANAVVLLDVSNPYEDPKVLQAYPLTGSPTCMDVDGYPVTRIAVGTDRGEVLVFKVEKGDVVGYVHRIFGADFYVNQVFVAKSPTGSNKIIALVSEGGPKAIPCSKCYVYAFDETTPGLFRAGPVVGNASLSMEKVDVQMVAPLKVFTAGGVYYDASSVFLAYVPTGNRVNIVINVSYVYNNTLRKAANAIIKVVAYSKKLNMVFIYGVSTDASGVARIPIPIIDNTVFNANISIIGIDGSEVWSYTFTPERHVIIDNEVYLPPVILLTPPAIGDASRLFGLPPFLQLKLVKLDLSGVPMTYSVAAELEKPLPIDTTQMLFVYGGRSVVAVFNAQSKGNTTLVTVATQGKKLVLSAKTLDYVGEDTALIDVATYPGSDYIVVGFSSSSAGKVRVYRVSSKFDLTYIYPFDSPIRRVTSAVGLQSYVYSTVLSSGLQLLLSVDSAVPLLRNNTELIASELGYVDGSVLPDLTAAFLVTPNSITIVKNLNVVVSMRRPVALNAITAPSVKLRIALPGNETLDKVYAVFYYPPNGSKQLKPDENGLLVLNNIIPHVNYSVYIGYSEPYIKPTTISVHIRDFRDALIPVNLSYKVFTVRLVVVDSISITPVAPYIVVVDGRVAAGPTKATVLPVDIVYGVHNITVAPAKEGEAVYTPVSTALYVSQDTTLDITLTRRVYNLRLVLIDSLTNSTPIAPLLLSVTNALPYNSTIPHGTGFVDVKVFYGNTTVTVAPGPGFEGVYQEQRQAILVANNTVVKVRLERIKYPVVLSLADGFGVPLLSPVDIIVNGTTYATEVRKPPRVELRLPYGLWVIEAKPSKGYENIYEPYTATVIVDGARTLSISMARVHYTLNLILLDDYGALITPVVVDIVGVVKLSYTIEPPMRNVIVSLPYGNYTVSIKPAQGYENVYSNVTHGVFLTQPLTTAIRVPRQKYTLSITVRDTPFGILRGAFDLLINGTKYAESFRGGTITLPYGVYLVQLMPTGVYAQMYEAPQPVVVKLFNNTNMVITVGRRMYTFTLYIREGATPIRDATVTLVNLETGAVFTMLISGDDGIISTKLPFASYEVSITHPNYYGTSLVYNIDSDKTDIVYLNPTVTTMIWRFSPLIITLVVIGIAIYAGLKIRAIIAKRLVTEEEVF
jgi:hypothetical protein